MQEYEDAQRRQRYCSAQLGRLKGQDGVGPIRSPRLRAALEKELGRAEKRISELRKAWTEEIELHPVYANFLRHVHGIGPVYAYRLLGSIGTVTTLKTPSQLRKMAGLGLTDGKPQAGRKQGRRRAAGFYHLHRVLGEIASRLIKAKEEDSFYRRLYLRRRGHYTAGGCREGAAKPHSGAMLDLKRILLSQVWACWRESLNLPAVNSYGVNGSHHEITWREVLAEGG
jgi:transposase